MIAGGSGSLSAAPTPGLGVHEVRGHRIDEEAAVPPDDLAHLVAYHHH